MTLEDLKYLICMDYFKVLLIFFFLIEKSKLEEE